MQLARVIGEVVATVKDANLTGSTLLVLQPIDAAGEDVGRTLVALDSVGAGVGECVFFVRGREAAPVGAVAHDPVATASTLLTDSTAGIYFVCTRPDARRRGFGAAITYEAMRHAARTGATFAVLRLLADGAARLRAARIPNHLLHPALRAGRRARPRGRTL